MSYCLPKEITDSELPETGHWYHSHHMFGLKRKDSRSVLPQDCKCKYIICHLCSTVLWRI